MIHEYTESICSLYKSKGNMLIGPREEGTQFPGTGNLGALFEAKSLCQRWGTGGKMLPELRLITMQTLQVGLLKLRKLLTAAFCKGRGSHKERLQVVLFQQSFLALSNCSRNMFQQSSFVFAMCL